MCEKINDRLNGSGCTDITAYEAMKAVRREERRNLIAELKALANARIQNCQYDTP